MRNRFGAVVLVLTLILTACGRDEQGGGGAPAPTPSKQPPVVSPTPEPAGGYTQGGGYCGILCRWRLRRQQRWAPCP